MGEGQQAKNRIVRRLAFTFLLLLVTKFAFEAPAEMGWIEGRSVFTLLQWVAFILNMLLVMLLLVIIGVWPVANRSDRVGKLFISVFLGLFMLGVVARRLGLSHWLERQGPTVNTASYVASSLIMMALLLGMTVMMVKDLQERTTRDIRAKLQGREESGPDRSSDGLR